MGKKLRIRKGVMAALIVLLMFVVNVGSASAGDVIIGQEYADENSSVGEIFRNADGDYERIVRVEKDGSFVTEVMESVIQKSQKAACPHPAANLIPLAEKEPDTRTIASENVCFQYRSKTLCRCGKCNATIYTYGPWKNHTKHDFPLFGKTCKTCGYTK